MKKFGIIGHGEIGQALNKCYDAKGLSVGIVDTGKELNTLTFNPSVLNIAIPFSKAFDFVTVVSNYIKTYNPELTIIHSTVLPGTTKKIVEVTGAKVVHSPVRGVHPNLYEGLQTFVKYVGSDDGVALAMAKAHLAELGIKSEAFGDSDATELAKILDTTYYGMCIAFHNDIQKICDLYGVSFDEVATKWNTTYNEGYQTLGKTNVIRPVLYPPKDGKIGGHCVIPNAELCKQIFDSPVFDYILKLK